MNGAELLHSVRLRWPDLTRVLLTGNAEPHRGALRAPVNEGPTVGGFYMKPWQPRSDSPGGSPKQLDEYRMLAENRRLRGARPMSKRSASNT